MTPMNILRIRENLGMTQAEFAALIGVTRPFIARLETGKQTPSRPLALLLTAIGEGWRPADHVVMPGTVKRTRAPQRDH
jgi:DNA-binding transcriptional regulator YiaG